MSVRVMIVEDSAVVRELLCHILGSDPDVDVVATARNGSEALQILPVARPDVVTMDVVMPGMDGYEATRRIMETCPVPIVIVSMSVDPAEASTTLRALGAGALAAARKPSGIGHPDYEKTAKSLIETVKLMSEVKVVKRWPGGQWKDRQEAVPDRRCSGPGDIGIVAMGASTGGPAALQAVLSGLSAGFPCPVVVVQHMPAGFMGAFAEMLSTSCRLPVRVAAAGECLMPGNVYLAPGEVHMGVSNGGRVILFHGPPVNGVRPSISYLFRSVAREFGGRAAGVLLTGMGKDGADGLKCMKEAGAVTFAQSEDSCLIFSMPCAAMRLGAASHALSPPEIAKMLCSLVKGS